MEQQQAGLGCNRHAHLVRELESAATLEVFLVEKDEHMSEKLALVRDR
jgi:hypothetical protein